MWRVTTLWSTFTTGWPVKTNLPSAGCGMHTGSLTESNLQLITAHESHLSYYTCLQLVLLLLFAFINLINGFCRLTSACTGYIKIPHQAKLIPKPSAWHSPLPTLDVLNIMTLHNYDWFGKKTFIFFLNVTKVKLVPAFSSLNKTNEEKQGMSLFVRK